MAPNGKIYMAPKTAENIGIFDPFTHTFSSITGLTTAVLGTAYDKFSYISLAPNGKVYLMPRSADVVAYVDPLTDTFSVMAYNGDDNKCFGTVASANGVIYCVPANIDFIITLATI